MILFSWHCFQHASRVKFGIVLPDQIECTDVARPQQRRLGCNEPIADSNADQIKFVGKQARAQGSTAQGDKDILTGDVALPFFVSVERILTARKPKRRSKTLSAPSSAHMGSTRGSGRNVRMNVGRRVRVIPLARTLRLGLLMRNGHRLLPSLLSFRRTLPGASCAGFMHLVMGVGPLRARFKRLGMFQALQIAVHANENLRDRFDNSFTVFEAEFASIGSRFLFFGIGTAPNSTEFVSWDGTGPGASKAI